MSVRAKQAQFSNQKSTIINRKSTLPSALCPLPFALCPLPFALCPLRPRSGDAEALQLIGAIQDGLPPGFVVQIPGDGFAESRVVIVLR